MELRDDSQRLICRPLHNDRPAGLWNGNSAEKPLMAIWSQTQTRGHMALQRLISPRQLVQYRPQDLLVIGRGNKLAPVIDDADHESPALVVLRLYDSLQGIT